MVRWTSLAAIAVAVSACGSPTVPAYPSKQALERELSQESLFVPVLLRDLAQALDLKFNTRDGFPSRYGASFVQERQGLVLYFETELVSGKRAALQAGLAKLARWADHRGFKVQERRDELADSLLAHGSDGQFDYAIEGSVDESQPCASRGPCGGSRRAYESYPFLFGVSVKATLLGVRYPLQRVLRDFPALTGHAALPDYFVKLLERYRLRGFSCTRENGICAHWHFDLEPQIEPLGAFKELKRENGRYGFKLERRWEDATELEFDPGEQHVHSYLSCAGASIGYQVVNNGLVVNLSVPDGILLRQCTARPIPPPAPPAPDPQGFERIDGSLVAKSQRARLESMAACYERARGKPATRKWRRWVTEAGPGPLALQLFDAGSGEYHAELLLFDRRKPEGFRMSIGEPIDAFARVTVLIEQNIEEDATGVYVEFVFKDERAEAKAPDEEESSDESSRAYIMRVLVPLHDATRILRDRARFHASLQEDLTVVTKAASSATDDRVRARLRQAYKRGRTLRRLWGERFRLAALAIYPWADGDCSRHLGEP